MKRHKFLNRDALFDRIVLIACRLIKSPLALIVCPHSRRTIVLGGFGFDDDEIPVPLKIDDYKGLPDRLNYLTKVQHQSWFQKGPLARVLPQARSVLVIPLRAARGRPPAIFFLLDPLIRWPFNSQITITLLDLAELASTLIELDAGATENSAADRKSIAGFSEDIGTSLKFQHGPDPVSQFLLDTLVSRQKLRSRNSVSYLALRSWRTPIKAYQLRAITALKKSPPPRFVETVAGELCGAVTRVYGKPSFNHVVPVPCGHSLRPDCLSVLLAREIGIKLNVTVTEPFVTKQRQGSSHPHKNAGLPQLIATTKVKGNILLVDDIASSGRHIEQAAQKLSLTADHVYPIVWISA